MAIYHFSAQIISRGAGRSSVAAAAYRHRTAMHEAWVGTDHRYEVRGEVAHAELALPEATPAWLKSLLDGRTPDRASEALWNRVEEWERRKDGQVARELNIALPIELTRAQQIDLARAFVRESFSSRGQIADWVLHDKPGNPHIHVMLTLRPLTETGFGPKRIKLIDPASGTQARTAKGYPDYRNWAGDRQDLLAWRAAWSEIANHHLARAGHDVAIDHRTHADRGIRLTPTVHLGPAGSAIKLKFENGQRDLALDRVRATNAAALEADPDSVIAAITREKSVFHERDIGQILLRHVSSPEQYERIKLKVLQSDQLVTLVPLVPDGRTGEPVTSLLYTAKDILAVERAMGERAARMAGETRYKVTTGAVERAITRQDTRIRNRSAGAAGLAEEQSQAIRYATGPERLRVVVGFAGAGKSTMLDAARDAWQTDGYRVLGAALAGKAAEELTKSSGIAARTLASWEYAWAQGRDALRRDDVLVIDEAGMIGSRQLGRVLAEAERRQAKVVLVGDAEQLQPIEAGAAFRAVAERAGYIELTGIRRQKHAWMREASMNFARGHVTEALNAYRAHGAIQSSETVEAARSAVVAGWLQDRAKGGSTLMLAYANENVKALNIAARDHLLQCGELGDEHSFQTERGERRFAVGDRVLFLKNESQLGVKNGMLGSVTEAAPGRLRVRLDGAEASAPGVLVEQARYNNLDWGYATTVHKAQGATVDRVRVLATYAMDRHLAYVAMTRHRESVVMHVPQNQFRTEDVTTRLAQSGAKDTTLDFIGRVEFLERRGHETPRTMGGALGAFVSAQVERLVKAKRQLAALRDRLEEAGRKVRDWAASRNQATAQAVGPAAAQAPAAALEGGGVRDRAAEIARATALSSPLYAKTVEAMRVAAARLYRDHAAAAQRIEARLSQSPKAAAETAGLAQTEPETFGALRDPDGGQHAAAALAGAVRTQVQAFVSAYDAALARARAIERALDRAPRESVRIEPPRPPLFAAVTAFARGVTEEAAEALRATPYHTQSTADLERAAGAVYHDPAAAVGRIVAAVEGGQAGQDLAAVLQRDPSVAGELRGSGRLLDGLAARTERRGAEASLGDLAVAVRYLGESWRTGMKAETEAAAERRSRMSVAVPSLSPEALVQLERLETVRRANPDAYSTEAAMMVGRASLNGEIARFREAVEQRFGVHDFRKGVEAVAGRVPADERDRLAKAAPSIAAAQRLGQEQAHIRGLSFNRSRDQGITR